MSYAEQRERVAVELESKIERVQEEIARLSAPLTQNWTARRSNIKAGQMKQAERLESVVDAMTGLAARYRANTVPPCIAGMTGWTTIRDLLAGWNLTKAQKEKREMLRLLAEEGKRLRVPDPATETAKRERERQAVRDRARTMNVPGFFPTPPALAERVVELAQIENHHTVLEPGAGIGSLVEAVHAVAPEARVRMAEINYTLRGVLQDLGYEVEWDDLFAISHHYAGAFHRIVMNPPFERKQAVEHVVKCLSLLAPGGRLVAVMPANSPEVVMGTGIGSYFWEDVDEGAFKGVQAFRQTGVRVRLLVVDKE